MLEATKLIEDIVTEKIQVKIPIFKPNTEEIGFLSPITLSILSDTDIIDKMTNWRNKNSASFLTKFTATPERTERWLKTSILSSKNRLILLIYLKIKTDTYSCDKLIGHLGFFDLTDISAEGDAIIRGEHGGGRDFIKYAALAQMNWFYTQFRPRSLTCRILSNNESAINMTLSIGYKIEKEVNVYIHNNNGEQNFREWGEKSQLVPDTKLIYLKSENPYNNISL